MIVWFLIRINHNSADQDSETQSWKHEAYLLFPVHLDGTLADNAESMKVKKDAFSATDVLQIFRQVSTREMHRRMSHTYLSGWLFM